MGITRENLEARLAQLKAQFERLQADTNAVGGAMQDCQYWITIVDGQDAQTTDLGQTGSGGTGPAATEGNAAASAGNAALTAEGQAEG